MGLKEKLGFKDEPIYVIDGSSYLYKAFYAYPDLSRSDGFPTNAIYIITRILLKIIREEDPKFGCFLIDGRKPTFRQQIYKDYKSKRLKMPESLIKQVPVVLEVAEILGFPVFVPEDVEADDCIASICERFKKDVPVVIVAIDKDLQQCLDEYVVIWDPSGRKDTIITRDEFIKKHGILPTQWPHFQALVGDPTDNIPGVPGIGPKTALKILKKFPYIEDIIKNFEKLSNSEKKKLIPHIDKLPIYLELTVLKKDTPPWEELEQYNFRPMEKCRLKDFFEEYEFVSLLKDFDESDAGTYSEKIKGPNLKKISQDHNLMFFDKLKDNWVGFVEIDGMCYVGIGDKEFCFSLEDINLDDLVTWLNKSQFLFLPSLKELICRFHKFENLDINKIFDISLATYLLNPEQRDYSWERVFKSHIKNVNVHIENHGIAALRIGEFLFKKIESSGLRDLMYTIELPLVPVLVHMENRGVGINLLAFKEFLKEVEKRLMVLTHKIYSHAGEKFNIRSNQQLANILFKKLRLKTIKRTPKGQPSTESSVLEALVGEHPIVKDILEYRTLEKLRSTYLKPLPEMVKEDGRLHTTFNNLATATGRLSSKNPNLQNIPIKGELGPRMRSCFVAKEGYLLIASDYSQIELRILAHLSQDPYLLKSFEMDEDIHANTASLLFDKAKDDVTADERRKAKTINFGLLYGMGPQKLARELGIKMSEAKRFIEIYFSKLKKVKDFYEKVETQAKEKGYVTTLSGRRRFLPDIHSRNLNLFQQAKRMAINTVVQGSAADIIKMSMIEVEKDEFLKSLGAELILQIHDELLLEVPEKKAENAAKRVAEIMSNIMVLSVPLKVEWGIGKNWAEAH